MNEKDVLGHTGTFDELLEVACARNVEMEGEAFLTQSEEIFRDPSGVILTPGGDCLGDGAHVDENGEPIECCCDECDRFLECFPEYNRH